MRSAALSAVLVVVFATELSAQVRDTVWQVFPDTLLARASRDTVPKSVRLCAVGDVTLGSNLDSLWARSAAANLWDRFGRRADPDSLLAPLRGYFAGANIVLINVEG